MSEHEWCRDVSRDEAVRAAEDAAAVPAILHRDLPEQVALLWASLTDILGRVVRIEGEIDAGEDEAEEAAKAGVAASPSDGMRTERVTLEFHIEGSPPTQWPWSYILRRSDAIKMRPGESVRVVEEARARGGRLPDMVAWITAERDAARAEAERLRSRAAELEAAKAAPPEPRGWLTAGEREAVSHFLRESEHDAELFQHGGDAARVEALRALLARSSPPRVKVPHLDDLEADERPVWESACKAWIAAIREAGGEVE